MITFLCYTYKGHEEFILLSTKQLLSLPIEKRIVIVDDLMNPMQKKIAKELQRAGCDLRYSHHERNGNLIGIEHTKYHVQLMNDLCDSPNDIVIKYDPDTLILSTEWIDRLAKDEEAVFAGAFKVICNYSMGLAYAVKGNILPALVNDVLRFPSWVHCFEDYEVSSRIFRLTDGDAFAIHRYNVNNTDGWVLIDFTEAEKYKKSIITAKVINTGAIHTKGKDVSKSHLLFTKKLLDLKMKEKEAKKEVFDLSK